MALSNQIGDWLDADELSPSPPLHLYDNKPQRSITLGDTHACIWPSLADGQENAKYLAKVRITQGGIHHEHQEV